MGENTKEYIVVFIVTAPTCMEDAPHNLRLKIYILYIFGRNLQCERFVTLRGETVPLSFQPEETFLTLRESERMTCY